MAEHGTFGGRQERFGLPSEVDGRCMADRVDAAVAFVELAAREHGADDGVGESSLEQLTSIDASTLVVRDLGDTLGTGSAHDEKFSQSEHPDRVRVITPR